jgi:hypothetical protein
MLFHAAATSEKNKNKKKYIGHNKYIIALVVFICSKYTSNTWWFFLFDMSLLVLGFITQKVTNDFQPRKGDCWIYLLGREKKKIGWFFFLFSFSLYHKGHIYWQGPAIFLCYIKTKKSVYWLRWIIEAVDHACLLSYWLGFLGSGADEILFQCW